MGRETPTLRATSERLDFVLRELDGHPDPGVRERMREAVALLMELHREGLERVLTLASDSALGGPALLTRLADDALVAPLLLVHRLHPYGVEVRLSRALDRLRPEIAAHGCRATLAGVDGHSARVRLEGGARLSERSTLGQAIEARLLEAGPELTAVAVELAEPPPPAPAPPALIQIQRHPPSDLTVGTKP